MIKKTDTLQLFINFEESVAAVVQETAIEIDMDELYAFDPNEPWWNR